MGSAQGQPVEMEGVLDMEAVAAMASLGVAHLMWLEDQPTGC